MPIELFSNNSATNLSSGINSSTTTIPVLSTTGFSTAFNGVSEFRLAIDQEIMIVGATGSGQFTNVQRGQEGTTAAAHSSGAGVYEVLTAGSLPRNNPQYLISGQQFFNASDSAFYPDGNILLDNSDSLYYGNSEPLTNNIGALFYGNAVVLADASGNLYYGNGTILTDANGDLYSNGIVIINSSGQIVSTDGDVVIDSNGSFSYQGGVAMTSNGTGQPGLYYPVSGSPILVDYLGNLHYSNGSFPTGGSVLADSSAGLHAPALFYDGSASTGTSGQFLSSTGTATAWVDVTQAFPIVSANLTGQSAAVASVVTTTPAALGTYRIGAYLNVTARTLDVIQVSVTYKDETGTSQTVLLSGLVSATGVTNISPVDIRANTGQAIIVKTVLTTGGGSIAYDIGSTIQQLN